MRVSRRLLLLAAIPLAAPAKKKKDRKRNGPLGLLAGTVFEPSGLSLRGVEMTAYETAEGAKGRWQGVTDDRGEFALRVPATADGIKYRVVAEAEGYQTMERELWAYEAQRTSANFRLKSSQKGGT